MDNFLEELKRWYLKIKDDVYDRYETFYVDEAKGVKIPFKYVEDICIEGVTKWISKRKLENTFVNVVAVKIDTNNLKWYEQMNHRTVSFANNATMSKSTLL